MTRNGGNMAWPTHTFATFLFNWPVFSIKSLGIEFPLNMTVLEATYKETDQSWDIL